ncbi:hypothetical protein [Primorskyibacter marinus]|uniref:hypothetical protein n=1 Tax=Primorskyibacter marinus TaxID=1977320 RepID=UPI0013002865|nr:hypothetical protein [Primorskyibacter marinus]
MQSMMFNPIHAWSLLDDLWTGRVFPENFIGGEQEARLFSLRQRRLVSDRTRTEARQMFIFAENVILPPSLDISALIGTTLYNDGAITWGNEDQRKLLSFTEPSRLNLVEERATALAPLVDDPNISVEDIIRVLRFWNSSHRFENDATRRLQGKNGFILLQLLQDDLAKGVEEENEIWRKLPPHEKAVLREVFADDPGLEAQNLKEKIRLTRDVYFFATAMSRLSEIGVPTFAAPRKSRTRKAPVGPSTPEEMSRHLVGLYFDNVSMSVQN